MSDREHFLLIKQSGFNAKGELLSACESAKALLNANMWPLWENTRCQHMVKPNHQLLIYLAGEEPDAKKVVASASVKSIQAWNDNVHKPRYPLLLDGIPRKVLILERINIFDNPISFISKLDKLSFIPENKKKWGIALMGGMRSLTSTDFEELKTAS